MKQVQVVFSLVPAKVGCQTPGLTLDNYINAYLNQINQVLVLLHVIPGLDKVQSLVMVHVHVQSEAHKAV